MSWPPGFSYPPHHLPLNPPPALSHPPYHQLPLNPPQLPLNPPQLPINPPILKKKWEKWTAAEATAILSHYPEVLKRVTDKIGSVKGSQLSVLDEFINKTLPENIERRGEKGADPFITHKELSDMMRWKILHKFRPSLQSFIDRATDAEVKLASTNAFKALKSGNLKGAVLALKVLKGCGPALASLVLSTFDGSLAAYMSDAALVAVCGTREYSLPECLELATKLKQRAAELGGTWTAQKLQQVIWIDTTAAELGYNLDGAAAGSSASSSASSSESNAKPAKLAGSKRSRDQE